LIFLGFMSCKPHGFDCGQAQEKPDFDEQPESAPEGIEDRPEPMRRLAADTVFLTCTLLHFGQETVSGEVVDMSTSKCSLHSLQTYS